VKGLRGAVKSNGYDHYITQTWGCPDLLHIHTYIYIYICVCVSVYIYELGPGFMPRVVNACKPSPRSDTPSSYWICEAFINTMTKPCFLKHVGVSLVFWVPLKKNPIFCSKCQNSESIFERKHV
jgi:hypothetical protein